MSYDPPPGSNSDCLLRAHSHGLVCVCVCVVCGVCVHGSVQSLTHRRSMDDRPTDHMVRELPATTTACCPRCPVAALLLSHQPSLLSPLHSSPLLSTPLLSSPSLSPSLSLSLSLRRVLRISIDYPAITPHWAGSGWRDPLTPTSISVKTQFVAGNLWSSERGSEPRLPPVLSRILADSFHTECPNYARLTL